MTRHDMIERVGATYVTSNIEGGEYKLTEADFQQTINNYLAYLMKEGKIYES